MSTSTPSKRSWGAFYYGGYPIAPQDLIARLDGVVTIPFQGPFQSADDDFTCKLFKLVKSVSAHGYCLVPIDVPGTNKVWDITYLSDADWMVWKFVIDLTASS